MFASGTVRCDARCGQEVITLSSPTRTQVRQEDGDEERGHQMHPADAQRDRDEADDRGEARQPDADGTGGRSQEEENCEKGQRRDPSRVRARPAPRHSDARIAPRTHTRNAGIHGRKRSARPIGSARRRRSGTSATTANALPSNAPRAARATALAPCPTRRSRWPGSVARAVSSVGAPKKTAGMKSNTAWLPAVARRKQESRRPIVSGSEEMSGTKTARKPAKAACVARTRAATLFT